MFVLFLVANFATQYRDFVNSPQKEPIFVGLTTKDIKIAEYADNPVVLWFWRTHSDDPDTDSLLRKVPMDRNFYLSAVMRWEAKETSNYGTAMGKLNLAVHFDSLAIENFLSMLALSVKYRKFGQLAGLFNLPVLTDFRNQIFLITNLVILLFAAIFICGLIYVLVKMIFYLPLLSHRIDPQKHNFLKGVIPFLILLVPILVFRHAYIILIIYAFLLTVVLNKREKHWLRFNILVLLLVALLSFPLNNFIPFLKGTSKAYQLYRLVNYDGEYRIKAEIQIEKELLALSLKQQGATDEAMSLYEDLYYNGNHNLLVVNNLANIYFLYEEDEKAEELYKLLLNKNRGEPYFNLGLLKMKNIEYLASSEFMEQARIRGFSSVSKEPVDIKPDTKIFYRLLLSRGFKLSQLIRPIFLVPLLIVLILTFLPFKFALPYFCSICGQAVCRGCLEESDGEGVCKDCSNKIRSTKSSDIEEDLRISLGRNKRFIYRLISYLTNAVVPGAGLIYQGKNFIGLLLVFLAVLCYIPIFFTGLFVKPNNWVCLPLTSLFIVIAVIVLICSYLFSFALLKGTAHAD